ncbi:MAG TPA: VOC family protein [Polyangiaceae bacterium]|nr:VOC family protein [Polyangiaceae bacterium]
MATIQKIVPCLWFDTQAEEAVRFYVSVFETDSRILRVSRYTHEGQEIHGRDPGTVMTVEFQLLGCELTALNAGPEFKFSEAISLQVMCDTQPEIDRLWEKLSVGGDAKAQQCGWLKDKFGLSWQIVPSILASLVGDSDVTKAARTMRALLEMKKLDIARLQNAHDGTS